MLRLVNSMCTREKEKPNVVDKESPHPLKFNSFGTWIKLNYSFVGLIISSTDNCFINHLGHILFSSHIFCGWGNVKMTIDSNKKQWWGIDSYKRSSSTNGEMGTYPLEFDTPATNQVTSTTQHIPVYWEVANKTKTVKDRFTNE